MKYPLWKTLLKYLTIASVISLIWQLIAGKEYRYAFPFPVILGMNSYTLVIWALGLVSVMILYDLIEYKFKLDTETKKIITFLLFYWIALIIVETIAVHVFNFRDLATIQYKGLPLCDCIHAKWWMKIVYFCMGPLMYLMTRLFKVKNVWGKK